MKIYFYRTTIPFPSRQNSSQWIGGDNHKIFFFDAGKLDISQIISSLPLNFREQIIYLIPEHWEKKENLLALLKEKYNDKTWKEKELPPEEKPLKEEIAEGWSEELARFYDENVTVTSVGVLVPQEPHVPEPHVQEPHVPEPHVQEPHMQEPHVPEPHVPEPHMQEPHVPEPHVQEPHMQEPHVPEPHVQEEGDNMKVFEKSELEEIDKRLVRKGILPFFSFVLGIAALIILCWQIYFLGDIASLKDKIENSSDGAAVVASNVEQPSADKIENSSDGTTVVASNVEQPSADKIENPEELLLKIKNIREEAEKAMIDTPPCLMTCKEGKTTAIEQVVKFVNIQSSDEHVKSEKEKEIRDILNKMVAKYPSVPKDDNPKAINFVCGQLKKIDDFIKEKSLKFAENIVVSDLYWKKNCESSSPNNVSE